MKTALSLLAFFALLIPVRATQIEGVDIAPQVTVAGKTLKLNGAAVRTFVLVFVPIKAYVATFYTPAPLRSESAVMASPGPMQFNFTFLQGVNKAKVAEAWQAQFDTSNTYKYANAATDIDAFVKLFGAVNKMGVQTVELVGDQTIIYEDGKQKGSIAGRDFQKAFLSLWFGSNPVTPDLKTSLLGN